jgi:hypothetical protein
MRGFDAKADLRRYLQEARDARYNLPTDDDEWWRHYRDRVQRAAEQAGGGSTPA